MADEVLNYVRTPPAAPVQAKRNKGTTSGTFTGPYRAKRAEKVACPLSLSISPVPAMKVLKAAGI